MRRLEEFGLTQARTGHVTHDNRFALSQEEYYIEEPFKYRQQAPTYNEC